MIEIEHMEAIRDSISASLPLLRQLAENSSPEPYTIQNIELTKFNIVISILALICSLFGAYYGWRGYRMSKLTAVNVERIKPNTQQRLIQEYFRYVLTSYIRLMVISMKVSKDNPPTPQYVNTLSLPDFNEFYYIDRFEQFKGCKISQINDNHFHDIFIISPKQRREVEITASRKATLEIRRLSMDIKRYEELVRIMLKTTTEGNEIHEELCYSMIKKINDIALRNLVVLSYIDGDRMCQCEYRIGREAILNYFIELDTELEGIYLNPEEIKRWDSIVDNIFNDSISFFFKLINNQYFNVEDYLHNSDFWLSKNIFTRNELRDYLAAMIKKLIVTQTKFY